LFKIKSYILIIYEPGKTPCNNEDSKGTS